MTTIRILIAEDHKLIRETWTSMLNSDDRFEVIAACSNTTDAIFIARMERPDIILMDINIPPINGLQATSRILEICPTSKVIGLSFHNEIIYIEKMFLAGAKGYLTKNSGCEELFEAIVCVHEGSTFICNEIREKGFRIPHSLEIKEPITQKLTRKEIVVTNCIRDGLRSKEIAGKMNISVRTVGVHRYNIFKKLNVNNSIALISLLTSRKPFAHPGIAGMYEM